MLCGSLDGRGVRGRVDICICTAESFCCPPKTITTLVVGYTLIKNKKFFFFLRMQFSGISRVVLICLVLFQITKCKHEILISFPIFCCVDGDLEFHSGFSSDCLCNSGLVI